MIQLVVKGVTNAKEEVAWDMNKATADLAEGLGRCTRRLAQTVRKNAKFPSNLAETVPCIARSAFQSARTKVVESR